MIEHRSVRSGVVVILGLLSTWITACQQSVPTGTRLEESPSVSAVLSEEIPADELDEEQAIGPTTFTGEVERLPIGNRLGRLTGFWTVDGRTVRVNDETTLSLSNDDVEVGDEVEVSGLQLTESFVIATMILDGPPLADVIQLDRTVPEQSAGRVQISVQIPPAQLTTPQFTIPPVDPEDPDAVFQRTSIEIFPGFTSYAASLASSFTLVEFDQLEIEGVNNGNCVIVHDPAGDPLTPENQLAVSEGCS